MSSSATEPSRRGSRRPTPGITTCPACAGPLKADAKWCPNCDFTGVDTVEMFPDPPPPLLQILDAASILREENLWKIDAARDALRRRFPQFHWRVCTVSIPQKTSLPVFGFWLLNVCPLSANETANDRAWTVLLLINAGTGRAAVVPGYAAEPFLSDTDWKAILATMSDPWRQGKPAEAIIRFFKSTHSHLDRAWNRYGARRSVRSSS